MFEALARARGSNAAIASARHLERRRHDLFNLSEHVGDAYQLTALLVADGEAFLRLPTRSSASPKTAAFCCRRAARGLGLWEPTEAD